MGHIPDDYELWFYIEDTDWDADDWDDSEISPTREVDECKSMCDTMNLH